jgi:hypothetical protein
MVVHQHSHFVELGLRHSEPGASLSPVGRQFMAFVQAAIGRARSDALVVSAPAPGSLCAAGGSAEALARSVIVGELLPEPAARALFEVVARTLH